MNCFAIKLRTFHRTFPPPILRICRDGIRLWTIRDPVLEDFNCLPILRLESRLLASWLWFRCVGWKKWGCFETGKLLSKVGIRRSSIVQASASLQHASAISKRLCGQLVPQFGWMPGYLFNCGNVVLLHDRPRAASLSNNHGATKGGIHEWSISRKRISFFCF